MPKPKQHKDGCPLTDPFHPEYGKIRECECFAPKTKSLPEACGAKNRDLYKPSLDEYDGGSRR